MPGYNGGIGGDNENNGGNGRGADRNPSGWDGGRNLTMNYPDIPGGFGYNPSAGAAGGMLHPLGMLGGVNYAPGSGGGFQMDAQGNIVDMAGNAPAPDGNGGIRYNTNGYNTNQPQGQFTDLTQAGLHAANQAYNLYGQGPQFAGFGDTSQQAHNQIKGLATGNQYLPQANQTVSNVMGGTNPYMQPYTPDVNPFLQGFSDFGANQNTAFNQTVDNAMNRVSDATNSQFGLSGRTGSGLHAGVMTDRLGNVANQMYSDNFAGNQARNLQAMQSGANTYANTQARNLQEQGQGINAWQNQNTQKLAAAGMVPSLNTAKFSDVNQLQMLGATQDRMAQGGLDAEGNNLQNYANIVAQLQGFQVPDRPESSNWDKLIGLGTMIGSYYE